MFNPLNNSTIRCMRALLAYCAETVLQWPRWVKRTVVLLSDASLCVFTVWLAFYLRLGEVLPLSGVPIVPLCISVVLALPLFGVFGLYRAIFRYSGLPAMVAVAQAMCWYTLCFALLFTVYGVPGVPRTVGLIQPLLLLVGVGALRAAARIVLEDPYHLNWQQTALPRALIYGAGSAGRQLASAMLNSLEMRVVGFVDDDSHLHGQVLNGLPIYPPQALAKIVVKYAITDVLLALPAVSRQARNRILTALRGHKVAVRTLPHVNDLATGKVSVADVQELDIDDLLEREPVQPHTALLHRNIQHHTVLVTGAGGSIGSELCRQILKCGPRRVLLVEMSEFALYKLHQALQQQLQEQQTSIEIVPLLASVCDEVRMQEIMRTWRPQTIYHAAAYKHVPLVEHNPAEGVRNNVWGTWVCAEAALRTGVRNFVLISTDKAVRPTNIMGATKRLAEMLLQALAERQSGTTTFSMVRFGNVLGSSGSVVPLFRAQIKKGGPLTLTHPEITRYFMSISEAAQLVIQAGAMGVGGDVFVLDMGRPVKIQDLACRMVELAGLTVKDDGNPRGDIAIHVTGLRPGEKLYEELLIGDNPQPTEHPRIVKAHEPHWPWSVLQEKLARLLQAIQVNDVPAIKQLLQTTVAGYTPNEEVVDWVHLAAHRVAVTVRE